MAQAQVPAEGGTVAGSLQLFALRLTQKLKSCCGASLLL